MTEVGEPRPPLAAEPSDHLIGDKGRHAMFSGAGRLSLKRHMRVVRNTVALAPQPGEPRRGLPHGQMQAHIETRQHLFVAL